MVEQLHGTLPHALAALAEVKAWQRVTKPKIDEVLVWLRDSGPLLTEMVEKQRVSQQAPQAVKSAPADCRCAPDAAVD